MTLVRHRDGHSREIEWKLDRSEVRDIDGPGLLFRETQYRHYPAVGHAHPNARVALRECGAPFCHERGPMPGAKARGERPRCCVVKCRYQWYVLQRGVAKSQ